MTVKRLLPVFACIAALCAGYASTASASFTAGWVSAAGSVNEAIDAATDSSGNVYVSGHSGGIGRVVKFNSAGTLVHTWTLGPGNTIGLAFDAAGNLYAANNGGIQKLSASDASGNMGSFAPFASGLLPAGIAIDDGNGVIYVAEPGLHRVTILSLVTGAALGYIGTGTSGNAAGEFNGSYAVDVDPVTGKVFVADTQNNRVQRFAAFPSNAYEDEWSVGGQPWGIGVHPTDGRVYVTDTTSGLLKIYRSDGTFINSFFPAAASPLGVHVHTDSKVYLADFVGVGGRRVRQFVNSAPALNFTSGPSGDTASDSATFNFTSSESAGFTCTDEFSANASACGSGFSSSESFAGLSQGAHSFTITGTDAYGNVSTLTRTWFVDTVNPTASLDDVTPEDLVTNQNDFTFLLSASDPAPSSSPGFEGFDWECSLNGGGSWVDCDGSGTPVEAPVSWVQNNLPDGVYNFQARVRDNAGNQSAATPTYTFTIDSTGPAITINRPYTNARYSKFADPKPDLTADFTCVDPQGVASCTGSVADGAYFDRTMGADPTSKTFVVNATDNAGNDSTQNVPYRVFSFEGLVKDDSPSAYYRMGDGVGATVMDDAMNAHDGEYKNRHASELFGVSGDGNSSRRFFGLDGYGFVNGISAPQGAISLGAFVKLDDVNGDGKADNAMIAQHGGSAALWVADEKVRFLHTDWDRSSEVTGPVLDENTWYHLMGTWDGEFSRLYVNSVLVATVDTSPGFAGVANGNRPSGSATFYVGYGDKAPWLSGYVDEVSYFDHALTPLHVYEHWLADPPPGSAAAQVAGNHAWRRPDGSLIRFSRTRHDVYVGRVVKPAAARAATGALRCRLEKGTIALKLKVRDPGYAGTVVDAVSRHGTCATRRLRVTARRKGDRLTLVKQDGWRERVERLVRTGV